MQMIGVTSVYKFLMLPWLHFESMFIAEFQSGFFFYFKFGSFCKNCNYNGEYAAAEDSTAFFSGVPDCIFNSLATN